MYSSLAEIDRFSTYAAHQSIVRAMRKASPVVPASAAVLCSSPL